MHGRDLPLEGGDPVRARAARACTCRRRRTSARAGRGSLPRLRACSGPGIRSTTKVGRFLSAFWLARRSGGRTSRSGRPSSSGTGRSRRSSGSLVAGVAHDDLIVELSASCCWSGNSASSTSTGKLPSGSSLSWRSPERAAAAQRRRGQRGRRYAHERARASLSSSESPKPREHTTRPAGRDAGSFAGRRRPLSPSSVKRTVVCCHPSRQWRTLVVPLRGGVTVRSS